jgi:hypothetical protein
VFKIKSFVENKKLCSKQKVVLKIKSCVGNKKSYSENDVAN